MDNTPIYIDFCDHGARHVKTDLLFYMLLKPRFDLVIADCPDYMVYSHNGDIHKLYNCTKIFHTLEADAPDWKACDYALTCHYLDDERHLRYPYYSLLCQGDQLIKDADFAERTAAEKSKFCAFMSSYDTKKTRHRWAFFDALSAYKQVDSGGKANNNIGFEVPYGIENTIKFLRPYKFFMAFENKCIPGYTTEKILYAMLAGCIPIYYGSPRVSEEFNAKSIINYHDFSSEADLIKHIRDVDNDDALYRSYLEEPYFINNTPSEYFDREYYYQFFEKIFARGPIHSSKVSHPIFGRWRLARKNR